MNININNSVFRVLVNSPFGSVQTDTIFYYYQKDDLIWGEYSGGGIIKGNIIGKIINDEYLEFTYQHISTSHELLSGKCKSYPAPSVNGKRVFKEFWQWTCRDFEEGESEIIEV